MPSGLPWPQLALSMASVHKLRIVFTQSAPGFPAIAVMHLSGEHGLYRRAGREHDGQAGLCDDAPHHPLTG